MKIYIAKHGQIVDLQGNASLTELGKSQAALLGDKLKRSKFQGKIYASPAKCAMETAKAVARETGAEICLTPWMLGDDKEAVEAQVNAALEELLTRAETEEEYLLIGNSASVLAVANRLNLRCSHPWNCCLGRYDSLNPKFNHYRDIGFLPGDMVSDDGIMAMDMEFDADCTNPYGIEIPAQLGQEKGLKILHIGDTHSAYYPFCRQIIRLVKPDVIIHTGDSADEIKVGRIDGTKESYLSKVRVLMDILKESGSTVYWNTGNNDLPEDVAKMAPFLHIVEPDTVVQIGGQNICLTHAREQITKEADMYLYGHGLRAPTFEEEFGTTWHLNCEWSFYVCVLPQKTLYRIQRPN